MTNGNAHEARRVCPRSRVPRASTSVVYRVACACRWDQDRAPCMASCTDRDLARTSGVRSSFPAPRTRHHTYTHTPSHTRLTRSPSQLRFAHVFAIRTLDVLETATASASWLAIPPAVRSAASTLSVVWRLISSSFWSTSLAALSAPSEEVFPLSCSKRPKKPKNLPPW